MNEFVVTGKPHTGEACPEGARPGASQTSQGGEGMKRCSKEAWLRCPDAQHCEMYAEFADGSECDQFNEKIMRETDGEPVDPRLIQPILWHHVQKRMPKTEQETVIVDDPDDAISCELSEFVLVADSKRNMWIARYETGPLFQGWVNQFGGTVRDVVYWAEKPGIPQEGIK